MRTLSHLNYIYESKPFITLTSRFIRYVYLFFRMVLLFGSLCHLRLLDVKYYQDRIVKQECDKKQKYNLSVLHDVFI